jgi:phenylalanyl-tRNA synthetase beta chain
VTPQTRNILLESAYFDPVTIRRASQSLGLVSDSSYRFERGVDYVVVKTASDRATGLILEVAGGKVGGFKDVGKRPKAAAKVSVRPKKVNGLLGLEILVKDITKILKSLGLGLENSSRGKMVFSIPSWRRDLKKETDLIEEIIRVYGYDRVPVVQPKDIDVQDRVFMPRRLEFQALVRDTLIGFGLDEVLTYSLVDKGLISVKNPLSPQLAALRSNLTQGVLSAAKWNLNRNINDIKLFEIGSVYSPQAIDSPEEDCLAICLSGSRSDNWQDGERKADFYYLKGIVEALFAKAGVSGYQIRLSPNDILSPQESADINIGTEHIGFLGRVKDELLNSMDIDKDCFVCEINLQRLLRHAKVDRRFSPLPKFPAVYRDISTLAEEKVSCGEMVSLIKEAGSELIKDVKLFDVYRGPQIPKGHKSLVYRLTYQSPDKTLTDKEVDAVHSRIIAALNEKLGVKTR